MTNRFRALTASVALLGVAGVTTGVSVAQAQTTPAASTAPVVAPAAPGMPLDLPTTKATTVQVTMTQWGLHAAPAGQKGEFSVIGKERAAIDVATRRARLEQFDMAVPAPGRVAPKPSMLVSDGTTSYELIGSRNQYLKTTVNPAVKGIASRLGLAPAGLTTVLGWNDAKFVAAPNETVDGKSLLVYVREYSARASQTVSYQYTAKVWADPDTKLPVRYDMAYKKSDSADGPTLIQRVDFSDWKLNQPIAPTAFVWNAPAGVTEYVAPKPPVLLAAGTVAPDFTAEKWGGGNLKLSDYKGKVVVLDFWATWCGPCQKSMPHVQHVADSIKGQDVVVIGVCVWDEKPAYEKWVPEHEKQYTFQFGFDPAGRGENSIASKMFKVSGIPTTYVIDKDGKVADAIVGYDDGDSRLEAALGKLGVEVPATKVASAK